MIFVDGERIDLKNIGKYAGEDHVMKVLAKAYQRLLELDFPNKPIKFKCDALENGVKEGKKGIYYPFTGEIGTPAGTSEVVYALSQRASKNNMEISYKPRGETMRKSFILHARDVDKILWLMCACPLYQAGRIYIEDLQAKAAEVAKRRAGSSTLTFYLYNEKSPLYDDESKLMSIGLAIGIANPEELSVDGLRNAIFDKVEFSEKGADRSFGYKWFNDAVDEFNPKMKALADVQKAIDKKSIVFNAKTFKWMLLDGSGNEIRILCPVEPSKLSLKREVLAAFCLRNSDAYNLINDTSQTATTYEDLTSEVALERELVSGSFGDFATMEWSELKALAKKNGIMTHGKKKDDLIKELEHKRETLVS